MSEDFSSIGARRSSCPMLMCPIHGWESAIIRDFLMLCDRCPGVSRTNGMCTGRGSDWGERLRPGKWEEGSSRHPEEEGAHGSHADGEEAGTAQRSHRENRGFGRTITIELEESRS